jgi:hypothetical protein
VAEDSIIASRGRAVAVARSVGIWKREKRREPRGRERGELEPTRTRRKKKTLVQITVLRTLKIP